MTLTEARLRWLVVITTFVGLCLAGERPLAWLRLTHAIVGTAPRRRCCRMLNESMEAHVDRLMERAPTTDPRQTNQPGRFACLPCVPRARRRQLAPVDDNALRAFLAAATIFVCLILLHSAEAAPAWCTPLLARLRWIPPCDQIDAAATPAPELASAMGVVRGSCFWQIPHFLAISLIYDDESRKLGLSC